MAGPQTDDVKLPSHGERALGHLWRRTLGLPDDALGFRRAQSLITAHFGTPAPRMGALRAVHPDDIERTLKAANADLPLPTALRELRLVMDAVSLETPTCASCGAWSIRVEHGETSTVPLGHGCPYCSVGKLEIRRTRIRKLCWTTGNLVPADVLTDRNVLAGVEVPLEDADILRWCGDFIDPDLEDALKRAGTSVHGFLGYLRHARRVLPDVNDTARILRRPDRHIADGREALMQLARAARAWELRVEPACFVGPPESDDRLRLRVDGRTYVVEGRIAQGDSCDVFVGSWDHRLVERVVLKVTRAPADADLVQREWSILRHLHESEAQGADFFTSMLPQPVASGALEDGRPVAIYRWRSGFQHSLSDVMRAHPAGVEGRVLVWLWKRLLEMLGFLHQSGVTHGAVLPPHVLVHPRDHGATLIGFGCAMRRGEHLPAMSRRWRNAYPRDVSTGAWIAPAVDLAMSARCVAAAAGGDITTGEAPLHLPAPLTALLAEVSNGTALDAWAIRERLNQVSRDVFGPPAYSPIPMPGW